MNSIRNYVQSLILGRSYDINLDQLLTLCRDDVIKQFDLPDFKKSYWIDCTNDYAEAPELVNEEAEFHGSLEEQSNFVVSRWKVFPESVHHELNGILQYVIHLRNSSVNRNRYTANSENEVRENVYEM